MKIIWHWLTVWSIICLMNFYLPLFRFQMAALFAVKQLVIQFSKMTNITWNRSRNSTVCLCTKIKSCQSCVYYLSTSFDCIYMTLFSINYKKLYNLKYVEKLIFIFIEGRDRSAIMEMFLDISKTIEFSIFYGYIFVKGIKNIFNAIFTVFNLYDIIICVMFLCNRLPFFTQFCDFLSLWFWCILLSAVYVVILHSITLGYVLQ